MPPPAAFFVDALIVAACLALVALVVVLLAQVTEPLGLHATSASQHLAPPRCPRR